MQMLRHACYAIDAALLLPCCYEVCHALLRRYADAVIFAAAAAAITLMLELVAAMPAAMPLSP